jgi:hypothetical protein
MAKRVYAGIGPAGQNGYLHFGGTKKDEPDQRASSTLQA